jgi:hypothetical protein
VRFVILEHDHPVRHWDLMLEAGSVLRTWRLAEIPALGKEIDATALGDHRVMYLDYEGPVSGDRGSVKRWDGGTYAEEEAGVLLLQGAKVRGRARLRQVQGTTWRFVWTE